MQPLHHDRLQRFEDLLEVSSEAMRSYSDAELGYADSVGDFLARAGAEYSSMGLADAENTMRALHAELVSARRGVNALTSERVTGRRREFERSVALRGLLQSAERLRADCASTREVLAETRESLIPVLLFAIEKGLVPTREGELSQAELEQAWKLLLAHPESRTAARMLAMKVSSPDIVILLGDLWADGEILG